MFYTTNKLKTILCIEHSLILPRERLLRFAHQHSSCFQRNEANDTVQMTYPIFILPLIHSLSLCSSVYV